MIVKGKEFWLGVNGSYSGGCRVFTENGTIAGLQDDSGTFTLADLAKGVEDVSELTGLDTDFAPQYYNPARINTYIQGTGIPALINLAGTADVNGNLTLKEHVEDGFIHQKPSAFVVRVAKSGADFTTIQGAISSLPADGNYYTILVAPGTYTEVVTIGRSNVSLMGVGAVKITKGSATSPTVVVTGSGILIDGFTIDAPTPNAAEAIKVDGSTGCIVRNCRLTDHAANTRCFWANSSSGIEISNCVVRGHFDFVSSFGKLTNILHLASTNLYFLKLSGASIKVSVFNCSSESTSASLLGNGNSSVGAATVEWDFTGLLNTWTNSGVTVIRKIVDRVITIGTVDGLQAALDGKSAVGHTHSISQVNDLQTTLDGKVSTSRTVSAGTGLAGGGALTADRTISLNSDAQDAVAKRHAQNTDTGTNAAFFRVTGSVFSEEYETDFSGYRAGNGFFVYDSENERWVAFYDELGSLGAIKANFTGKFTGTHHASSLEAGIAAYIPYYHPVLGYRNMIFRDGLLVGDVGDEE